MKKLNKLFLCSSLLVLALISCKKEVSWRDSDKQTTSYDFEITNTQDDSKSNSKKIAFTYNSKDAYNKDVKLSGYANYKSGSTIDLIILNCHGTLLSNSQAPSVQMACDFDLTQFGSKNVLLIAPDYLGFGKTRDKVHPYLVEELLAKNIVDCELALLSNDNDFTLSDTCKTIIVGYSQGGATSLAAHKYIESKLSSDDKKIINLAKSYCGAGPYCLTATMENFFAASSVIPMFVYYTINGMLNGNYSYLADYELSDFFTTDFLESDLCKAIDAKEFTIPSLPDGFLDAISGIDFSTIDFSDTNALMLKVILDPEFAKQIEPILNNEEYMSFVMNNTDTLQNFVTLFTQYSNFQDKTKLLKEDFLDTNSKINKDFVKALEENDLSKKWDVQYPVNFYHHKDDDMVPVINFTTIKNNLGDNSKCGFYLSEDSISADNTKLQFVHQIYAENTFYPDVISDITINY